MASTYLLKNLSHENVISCLDDGRFGELDASSIEAYGALLRAAGAVLDAGDALLGRHGVTQARLRLLAQLRLAGVAGTTPAALAERIGVARPTITRLLDGLEREGLARRGHSVSDGRSLVVHLSASGEALLRKVLPPRVRGMHLLTRGLSAAEKREFVRLLGLVEANARRWGRSA
jgi:DNA-binding MarR family transcriptional regulator